MTLPRLRSWSFNRWGIAPPCVRPLPTYITVGLSPVALGRSCIGFPRLHSWSLTGNCGVAGEASAWHAICAMCDVWVLDKAGHQISISGLALCVVLASQRRGEERCDLIPRGYG